MLNLPLVKSDFNNRNCNAKTLSTMLFSNTKCIVLKSRLERLEELHCTGSREEGEGRLFHVP